MATATTTPTPAGDMPLPTRRDEAWRYAPHRELAQLNFRPAPEIRRDVDAALAAAPQLDGLRVVLVNGVVDEQRSQLGSPSPGVTVGGGPAVADELDEDAPVDAYDALNRSLAGDGLSVEVDAAVDFDQPIHIVHVLDPAVEHDAYCGRVRIALGEGSTATIVETHVGAGDTTGGANVRTTAVLAAGATLEHLVLQDLAASQVLLARLEVRQGADSRLQARSFNLGASYGRVASHVDLAGEGADADLAGLYSGNGEQVLDQQPTVVHRMPGCTSRQAYRGVLDDSSTGVFSGGIDVRPGADGTDARQSNDNLLLSRQAEVDTQPRLEILADDVACQHGATVGQLDQTALFYLRSRGVPADEAARVLINAFADQVVDEVRHAAVRQWLAQLLGHDHE